MSSLISELLCDLFKSVEAAGRLPEKKCFAQHVRCVISTINRFLLMDGFLNQLLIDIILMYGPLILKLLFQLRFILPDIEWLMLEVTC